MDVDYVYITEDTRGYNADLRNERRKLFDNFVTGMVDDADNEFYANGSYEALLDDWKNDISSDDKRRGNIVILSGAVWELCISSFYYRHGMFRSTSIEDFSDLEYAYADIVFDGVRRTSIKEWFRIFKASDKGRYLQDVMTDLDRWYWDQCDGTWNADIDYGFNIYDNIRIIEPLNCRYFFRMLYGFSQQDRFEKEHEKLITRMVLPEIKDIPYAGDHAIGDVGDKESKQGIFSKVRDKARKVFRRLDSESGKAKIFIRYYGIKGYRDFILFRIRKRLKRKSSIR